MNDDLERGIAAFRAGEHRHALDLLLPAARAGDDGAVQVEDIPATLKPPQ